MRLNETEMVKLLPAWMQEDGVIVIQGKTYDGSSARVTIKGEEVRYYGKQRTLAAIRAGQCRPPALRP